MAERFTLPSVCCLLVVYLHRSTIDLSLTSFAALAQVSAGISFAKALRPCLWPAWQPGPRVRGEPLRQPETRGPSQVHVDSLLSSEPEPVSDPVLENNPKSFSSLPNELCLYLYPHKPNRRSTVSFGALPIIGWGRWISLFLTAAGSTPLCIQQPLWSGEGAFSRRRAPGRGGPFGRGRDGRRNAEQNGPGWCLP